MKRVCFLAMAVLGGLAAHAQTNTSGMLALSRGPTVITSASAEFNLSGHEAIYRGHVCVDDPQMKLACERLVADIPQSGGRVSHIVAETNVVIDFTDDKGQTNHVTCDKAVYIFNVQDGVTNETTTLTGNPQPRMENAQGTQAGDVIIWSRVNGHDRVSISGNYRMTSHQKFSHVAADTNSPAPTNTTNSSPETIKNPDTNLQ